ncbi:unnamed protein product [Arctogadus glacialis]
MEVFEGHVPEAEKRAKIKKSGSEGGTKRPWKYMGILSFLEPHVQDRETTSNYSKPQAAMDDSVHSSASPRPQPPPPPPRGATRVPGRRRSQESTVTPYQQWVLEAMNREQDEQELFLLCFASALRRLDFRRQAMARLRMQNAKRMLIR